jgi:cytoskeletal protein CcmA (bactofilin family)
MDPSKKDEQDENPLQNPDQANSLEGPDTVVEQNDGDSESKTPETTTAEPAPETPPTDGIMPAPQIPKPKKKLGERVRDFAKRFNIYLLLFVLILIIVGIIVFIAIWQAHKNAPTTPTTSNQTLSEDALKNLANTSTTTVGNSKQILNVESSAIFAGPVLMRSDLEVTGTIKVGGALSLPGITVAGNSTFGQISTGSLSVSGDAAVQGNLTVIKSLAVNGSASFNGAVAAQTLSVSSLQLNGDLTLTHHITAGGPIPGKSDGSALGGGGTSSVSGSDTAGQISINTGGGAHAGCFMTLRFTTKFNNTARVLLTPTTAAAATTQYYVQPSTSGFSVCTANDPPSGANIGFDYATFD